MDFMWKAYSEIKKKKKIIHEMISFRGPFLLLRMTAYNIILTFLLNVFIR